MTERDSIEQAVVCCLLIDNARVRNDCEEYSIGPEYFNDPRLGYIFKTLMTTDDHEISAMKSDLLSLTLFLPCADNSRYYVECLHDIQTE